MGVGMRGLEPSARIEHARQGARGLRRRGLIAPVGIGDELDGAGGEGGSAGRALELGLPLRGRRGGAGSFQLGVWRLCG